MVIVVIVVVVAVVVVVVPEGVIVGVLSPRACRLTAHDRHEPGSLAEASGQNQTPNAAK